MRWIPFIAFFLYVYVEISIFIQVAHVLGVLLTLILVIFSSVVGMSLVRNQGFKNLMLMQQKMAAGESPAAEMIKSVSLILAGLLLLIPGFFTDFLGLLLLLPPVQKLMTVKLMPYLRFSRMPGGGFSAGGGNGDTFEGEFQRKDDERDRLDHNRPAPVFCYLFAEGERAGKANHSTANMMMAYKLFQPTMANSSRHSTLPTVASTRYLPCRSRHPASMHSR